MMPYQQQSSLKDGGSSSRIRHSIQDGQNCVYFLVFKSQILHQNVTIAQVQKRGVCLIYSCTFSNIVWFLGRGENIFFPKDQTLNLQSNTLKEECGRGVKGGGGWGGIALNGIRTRNPSIPSSVSSSLAAWYMRMGWEWERMNKYETKTQTLQFRRIVSA